MPFTYQPQAKIDRQVSKALVAAGLSRRPFTNLEAERHSAPTPGQWATAVWFEHRWHSPATAPAASILCDGYFEDQSAVYETLVHYLDEPGFNTLLSLEEQGFSTADLIQWAKTRLAAYPGPSYNPF